MKKAVVIIPTYNEKENIESTIDELEKEFKKVDKKYQMQILIVDDNSPDGTANKVKEKTKKYPNLRLYLNPVKKGLGAAYVKGMRYAIDEMKADLVFEYDADGSHQAKYIPGMLQEITKGADAVVGSRYIPGGSMPEDWGIDRKIVSYFGNLIARTVFLTFQYRDMTSGFRVTKTEFLKKIDLENLLSMQYAYKLHLYYALHKLRAKIVEYPIEFIDRTKGKSKFPKNNIKDSLRVVFTLRLREWQRFLKVCMVGFIGAVIQFTVFNLLRLSLRPAFANALAVELAIMSNFFLNNVWTFSDKKITVKRNGRNLLSKLVQFNLFSLGSLIIQFLVIQLGVSFFGRGLLLENFLVLIGILLGLIYNFTIYTKLIWKTEN